MATKAATEDQHHASSLNQIKHFDNLRNILKNARHSSGLDLYQHLVDVMNHIVSHCPENGIDKFEEISYLLKLQREGKITSLSEFLKIAEDRSYSRPAKVEAGAEKYLQKAQKLWSTKKEGATEGAEGGAEDAPAEGGAAGPICNVPDILADSRIYQWGGIGFGENETLLLAKSLKQLAQTSGAGNIRLWGKIHGTKRDYYIAEGKLDGGAAEGDAAPTNMEPRGTGVNTFAYWATNSPLEAWTLLPDLAPADIQAARDTKVHFTGELDRKIITNPFFFKTEKVYLRAQIARIVHSTTIIPKGVFKTNAENEKEVEDNNDPENPFVMPNALAMAKADNWVHFPQNILKCNLTAHKVEIPEGDETGETLKRVEAADPQEKRLKPITLDGKVKGGLPSWVVKHHGDKDLYYTPKGLQDKEKQDKEAGPEKDKKPIEQVNYGVVVVKSLQWPGAHTFFSQGRYFNLYVGDGLKYEQKTFYPIFPPVIREDPVEKPCFIEPNPRGFVEGQEISKPKAEAVEEQ